MAIAPVQGDTRMVGEQPALHQGIMIQPLANMDVVSKLGVRRSLLYRFKKGIFHTIQ